MKPAPSIIFFTVTAGAGYGLFTAGATALHTGTAGMTSSHMVTVGIVSLVLISAGLLSSTMHLANVKNVWRSLNRISTSWLSREGALALAFYPLSVIYLLLLWGASEVPGTGVTLLGAACIAIALLTLYATGMIYGCLVTIRQWHTPLTPLNYIGGGLVLGVLLLGVVLAIAGQALPAGPVLIVVLCALVAKLSWYLNAGSPRGITLAAATGFERRTVRLLDIGHTAGNFLTDEFCYELSHGKAWLLRCVSVLMTYVVPIAVAVLGAASAPALAAAAIIAYAGMLVERWLFFAEGRHVVEVYHGATRV